MLGLRKIRCTRVLFDASAYYSTQLDFRRPLTVVTPTLDGDVLAALAGADEEFSGRELARRAGHGSTEGIRRAADRLAAQGIVSRRAVGGAHLYRLNRDHIAAQWIEGLATLPEQLIGRLRESVAAWQEAPRLVFLFGSVARRDATAESDMDLLVVQRRDCDPDSEAWRSQLLDLQRTATALSGNDARVLEMGEEDISAAQIEPVLEDVLRDGVELFGSRRELRRLLRSKARR
jgi:predicted nucleotidyltransferase